MEQAELFDWYGRKAREQSNFDEAIRQNERAVQLAPSNPSYAVNLAKTYSASGRYADAVMVARRAMTMTGIQSDALISAAVASGDALRDCIRAKQKQCGGDRALTDAEVDQLDKQGEKLLSEKRLEESLPLLLRAYAYSGKPRAMLSIARFEFASGNYETARLHARAVEVLAPKSAKLAAEREELVDAIALECEKRDDKCFPGSDETRAKPAELKTTARATSDELAMATSSDPEVQTKRGNDALAAHDSKRALEAFERAASLDPQNAKYAFNLAVGYRERLYYDKAISTAQRVLSMPTADRGLKLDAALLAGDTVRLCTNEGSGTCVVRSRLTAEEVKRLDEEGQALVQAKRPEEALPIFLRAYAWSGDSKPLLRIATFEYVTGHYKSALEHARRVRDLEPEKASELRKATEELIRVILADCKQARADCLVQ